MELKDIILERLQSGSAQFGELCVYALTHKDYDHSKKDDMISTVNQLVSEGIIERDDITFSLK